MHILLIVISEDSFLKPLIKTGLQFESIISGKQHRRY